MTGNSFTNWSKITPRHNAFIQKILQSPVHILATIRSRQDYVLSEKNGKMVPEKSRCPMYSGRLTMPLQSKNCAPFT
jgi:hypothetical protein